MQFSKIKTAAWISESNQAFVPSDLSYLSMGVQPNATRLVKSNAKRSKQASNQKTLAVYINWRTGSLLFAFLCEICVYTQC